MVYCVRGLVYIGGIMDGGVAGGFTVCGVDSVVGLLYVGFTVWVVYCKYSLLPVFGHLYIVVCSSLVE